MNPSIEFINHACLLVETQNVVFLSDPWLQGDAFGGAWSLLDRSTSNADLIKDLESRGKPLKIWYSHEHADHFSVSFVREVAVSKLDVTVYFRPTLDNRVAHFLDKLNVEVVCSSGEVIEIDQALSLSIHPYGRYDSFCVLKIGDFSLLNLNDCGISTRDEINYVKKELTYVGVRGIDCLATQFGFANWVGNVDNPIRIQQAAHAVLERCATQVEAFRPNYLLPFASFAAFVDQDNAYLNKFQNGLDDVAKHLKGSSAEVLFPTRNQKWEFSGGEVSTLHDVEPFGVWDRCRTALDSELSALRENQPAAESIVSWDELNSAFAKMDTRLRCNFGRSWNVVKKLLFRPKLVIHLTDLDRVAKLTYRTGLRDTSKSELEAHFSIRSDNLKKVLETEYGGDTLTAGAAFQMGKTAGLEDLARFFFLQNLARSGYGVSQKRQVLRGVVRRSSRTVRTLRNSR